VRLRDFRISLSVLYKFESSINVLRLQIRGLRGLAPSTGANRKKAVDELLRVTKPGGLIIVVTPNRLFPIDEHGAGKTGLRWHLPFRDQTLSYFELRKLFMPQCDQMGVFLIPGLLRIGKAEALGRGADGSHRQGHSADILKPRIARDWSSLVRLFSEAWRCGKS
jgi:SAM-dependent methyltransferase